jgi:hypothetical protein
MRSITCLAMDGEPFVKWELPKAMTRIKNLYMETKGGDRDFVELLMLVRNMTSQRLKWPANWLLSRILYVCLRSSI